MSDILKKEKREKPPDGWVQIPIRRGVFEVEPLLDLCDRFGGMIIGGYARWMCSPAESPRRAVDCDIFPVQLPNGPHTAEEIFASWEQYFLNEAKLEIRHSNEVSITYEKQEDGPFDRCPIIQLIKPVEKGAILTKGTLEEVLGNFDFTVTRVGLNKDRRTATAWASFAEDETKGLLRILNIHCPISSLLRVMKYGRKGYYMRPAEAVKLFNDWQTRSPEYRLNILALFEKGNFGDISKEEIDELEGLLHID